MTHSNINGAKLSFCYEENGKLILCVERQKGSTVRITLALPIDDAHELHMRVGQVLAKRVKEKAAELRSIRDELASRWRGVDAEIKGGTP